MKIEPKMYSFVVIISIDDMLCKFQIENEI